MLSLYFRIILFILPKLSNFRCYFGRNRTHHSLFSLSNSHLFMGWRNSSSYSYYLEFFTLSFNRSLIFKSHDFKISRKKIKKVKSRKKLSTNSLSPSRTFHFQSHFLFSSFLSSYCYLGDYLSPYSWKLLIYLNIKEIISLVSFFY